MSEPVFCTCSLRPDSLPGMHDASCPMSRPVTESREPSHYDLILKALDGGGTIAAANLIYSLVQRCAKLEDAMREMQRHVHEQNPGGITSRPRSDVKVHRRHHREVVPMTQRDFG